MLDRVLADARANGGMVTLADAYAANYAGHATPPGVEAERDD